MTVITKHRFIWKGFLLIKIIDIKIGIKLLLSKINFLILNKILKPVGLSNIQLHFNFFKQRRWLESVTVVKAT